MKEEYWYLVDRELNVWDIIVTNRMYLAGAITVKLNCRQEAMCIEDTGDDNCLIVWNYAKTERIGVLTKTPER